MLTVRQLLEITTRRSTPPWHAGELRTILNLKGALSLTSVISGFETQKIVLFVQIRDGSILKSVNTLADLDAAWKSSHPGKNTVSQLSEILAASGAFIIAVSEDGETVGIAGTVKSLVAQPIIHIININSPQTQTGIKDVATGVVILIGVLALPEGLPFWLAYAAAAGLGAGGGTITGMGILEITSDSSGQPPPALTSVPVGQTDSSVLVFGSSPPGVTATDLGEVDNWPEFTGSPPPIDLGEVEDWPEFSGSGVPIAFGGGDGNGGGGGGGGGGDG